MLTFFPDEFEQKDKVQGRVVTMTKVQTVNP